jgi:ATP-dependent Lhr-like helicase
MTWGLSATLGNLDRRAGRAAGADDGVLVEGHSRQAHRRRRFDPRQPSRFPWGGHLGVQMLLPVIAEIEGTPPLVFTNTLRRRSCGTSMCSMRGPTGPA